MNAAQSGGGGSGGGYKGGQNGKNGQSGGLDLWEVSQLRSCIRQQGHVHLFCLYVVHKCIPSRNTFI